MNTASLISILLTIDYLHPVHSDGGAGDDDNSACGDDCALYNPAEPGIKCSSHSDCEDNAPFIFCWGEPGVIGECAPCLECWYCDDGIDGTCGQCESGPTMET